MPLEMKVMDLLISKICHDLISPVSAINNGVELMTEIGGDVGAEAMDLIGTSAVQAARKLRLFRLAYGRAGTEGGINTKDVREMTIDAFSGAKISLQWADGSDAVLELPARGIVKVLLNTMLVAEEALPYGGGITVHGHMGSAVVKANGRSAGLQPASQSALDGHTLIDDLSPRTIQSHITRYYAQNMGFTLRTEAMPEIYAITIKPPGENLSR